MHDRFEKRIRITPEVLRKIAKIDEFKGLWKGGVRLSPQILSRLKRSVIITSTGASTRIEGSEMSDTEVERFLRGLKSEAPKNRDEQEVAGYADLLGRIFDNYKTLKISEGNILQFHEILLQFSEKDVAHRGSYKRGDNTVIARNGNREIVLFAPTKPYLVKPEMDTVMDWANREFAENQTHPILIIANFIFEFLAIHPFIDGNGRLSRALTNLLLLRAGYSYVPYVSLDEIIENQNDSYYKALRKTQKHHKTDHEDISPWLVFFVGVLLEQVERARVLMEEKQPEKLLSERQEQVFSLFVEGEVLSVSRIDEILKGTVPQITIKQVLKRLVEMGMLDRMGQGRGTRYTKR